MGRGPPIWTTNVSAEHAHCMRRHAAILCRSRAVCKCPFTNAYLPFARRSPIEDK